MVHEVRDHAFNRLLHCSDCRTSSPKKYAVSIGVEISGELRRSVTVLGFAVGIELQALRSVLAGGAAAVGRRAFEIVHSEVVSHRQSTSWPRRRPPFAINTSGRRPCLPRCSSRSRSAGSHRLPPHRSRGACGLKGRHLSANTFGVKVQCGTETPKRHPVTHNGAREPPVHVYVPGTSAMKRASNLVFLRVCIRIVVRRNLNLTAVLDPVKQHSPVVIMSKSSDVIGRDRVDHATRDRNRTHVFSVQGSAPPSAAAPRHAIQTSYVDRPVFFAVGLSVAILTTCCCSSGNEVRRGRGVAIIAIVHLAE